MKVVYFYHIPKCGGSYVYRLLKKFGKATNGEFVPFNNLGKEKKIPALDQKLFDFIGSLKDYSKNKVLLIHHHHGYPGIEELHEHLSSTRAAVKKTGNEMVIISTVRDPLSYSISKVNYLHKKGSPIDFNKIIDRPKNHNMMAKYLLYNHFKRWESPPVQVDLPLLEKNLQLFDRIFLTERMNQLTQFLNDFLGTKNITIKNKINKGNLIHLPTDEQKARILDINKVDQHFYDLVKNKEPEEGQLLSNRHLVSKNWLPDWLKF